MINPSELSQLSQDKKAQFKVKLATNLYDSPQCERLATQAACNRHLRFLEAPQADSPAVRVELVEDQYPGWLALDDLTHLEAVSTPYTPTVVERAAIAPKLAAIIAFTRAAQGVPNEYLWGGTVAPHYDCSGLMQAAFWSEGIWLPRDAYQQEAFVDAIEVEIKKDEVEDERVDCTPLEPGDLIFFGTPQKATHVALYLGCPNGYGQYIHSSGKDIGRNGIGVDELRGDEAAHPVSRAYFQQFRGAGRVMQSYQGG